jgi:hypothetical protein
LRKTLLLATRFFLDWAGQALTLVLGLAWFGFGGFSFDESPEPQLGVLKKGSLAEAPSAHNALRDKAEYPRPNARTAYAVERWLITSR